MSIRLQTIEIKLSLKGFSEKKKLSLKLTDTLSSSCLCDLHRITLK